MPRPSCEKKTKNKTVTCAQIEDRGDSLFQELIVFGLSVSLGRRGALFLEDGVIPGFAEVSGGGNQRNTRTGGSDQNSDWNISCHATKGGTMVYLKTKFLFLCLLIYIHVDRWSLNIYSEFATVNKSARSLDLNQIKNCNQTVCGANPDTECHFTSLGFAYQNIHTNLSQVTWSRWLIAREGRRANNVIIVEVVFFFFPGLAFRNMQIGFCHIRKSYMFTAFNLTFIDVKNRRNHKQLAWWDLSTWVTQKNSVSWHWNATSFSHTFGSKSQPWVRDSGADVLLGAVFSPGGRRYC